MQGDGLTKQAQNKARLKRTAACGLCVPLPGQTEDKSADVICTWTRQGCERASFHNSDLHLCPRNKCHT